MDPQNPLNQPTSQPLTPDPIVPEPGLTPPPSSFASPLPITPIAPDMGTTTTTTTTPSETMTSTSAVPTTAFPDITAPVTTTVTTPEATTTTTTVPTPAPEVPAEAQWPEQKPKSKTPQILLGILALFLVVGAAVGAYFVSSKVSQQASIAPTAPLSEPLANEYVCGVNKFSGCGADGGCPVGELCSTKNQVTDCRYYSGCPQPPATPTPTDAPSCVPPKFACGSKCCNANEQCSNGSCWGSVTGTLTPTATINTSHLCPSGWSCKSYMGGNACLNAGGDITQCETKTGGSGNCCTPNEPTAPTPSGPGNPTPSGPGNPTPSGPGNPTPPVGGYSCEDSCGGKVSNGACEGGGVPLTCANCCKTGSGPTPPGGSCTTARITDKIKFSKTGKVAVYSKSPVQFRADIVLTGPKNNTLGNVLIDNKIATVSKTFDVVAGEEYTYSVRVIFPSPAPKKPAYGWNPPPAAGQCGPKNNPGTGAGKCGARVDINPLLNYAKARADITGIKAGTTAANVQCWSDAIETPPDPVSDYDYNDFSLVFGYVGSNLKACNLSCTADSQCQSGFCDPTSKRCRNETCPTKNDCTCGVVVGGACMEIKILKEKADGTFTAPLTQAQLNNLKEGDKIRLTVTGNKANLKAKFRVVIDEAIENPTWRSAAGYTDDTKKISYYDYEITKVGDYTFRGIVSTK